MCVYVCMLTSQILSSLTLSLSLSLFPFLALALALAPSPALCFVIFCRMGGGEELLSIEVVWGDSLLQCVCACVCLSVCVCDYAPEVWHFVESLYQ